MNHRSLVDLTSKLDSSGHLSWEVPPGTWTLQVFRHRSTGDQPHPILPDEGGLECDKLSPEAVDAHWNGYIRRVLDECGPAARRVIRWVHADSYEFGPQTWTPKFREEFKRRCGYDPLPYLPAIVGKVVDEPGGYRAVPLGFPARARGPFRGGDRRPFARPVPARRTWR